MLTETASQTDRVDDAATPTPSIPETVNTATTDAATSMSMIHLGSGERYPQHSIFIWTCLNL